MATIKDEDLKFIRTMFGNDKLRAEHLAKMTPQLVRLSAILFDEGVRDLTKLSRAEAVEDVGMRFRRRVKAERLSLKAPDDDGDWEAEAKRQAEINNAVPVL